MASRKKKKSPQAAEHRKFTVIGLLMIVIAVFVLLAFVSHTDRDLAVTDISILDFARLFEGDPAMQARADTTANWLGLFGALMSQFFIGSVIGYWSLAFPVLLGIWGWFIVAHRDKTKVLAYYSNYIVFIALLGSALSGLLRLVDWFPEVDYAWSGNLGDYIAIVLSQLIGTTGSLILLLAAIFTLFVLLIDYDIRRIGERLSIFGHWIGERFQRDQDDDPMPEIGDEEEPELPVEDEAAPEPEPPRHRRKPKRMPRKDREPTPVPKPREPVTIAREDAPAFHSKQSPSPANHHDPYHGTPVRSNGQISINSIPGLANAISEAGEGNHPDALANARIEVNDSEERSQASRIHAREQQEPNEEMETAPRSRVTIEAEPGNGSQPRELVGDLELAEASELVAPSQIKETEELLGESRSPQKTGSAKPKKRVETETPELDEEADAESLNAELATARLSYQKPTMELLDPQERVSSVTDEELQMKGELLREKLSVFGIEIKKISVTPGPVVTMFELVPESSVKISKIVSLSDDLALALAARGIRIIAPIPGKGAVGVEIPNNEPEIVRFSSVVKSSGFKSNNYELPIGLGKSITGEVYTADLNKMPHILIAGATGAGKSVGVNTMISSLLYSLHPSDVKMVMIDPKKIELAQYRDLDQHFLARCPDIKEDIITDPGNAVIALKSLEVEMDNRYTKLAKAGVRNLVDYNAKVRRRELKDTDSMRHYKLPFIVVIIDELADLMITASKEVEEPIARLAQLARAVGIHLIVATQRPSVDVLTGVIKANFPARIAYKVASRVDSRTILDSPGADRLLGNGDLLYQPSGYPKPVRIQNAFLSTSEVERVVAHIAAQTGFQRPYLLPSINDKTQGRSREESIEQDELLLDAARLVIRHQQGSVSLLQRRLKVGYSRAARIVDQLEMAGIVGPPDGSKAREVLLEDEIMAEHMLEEA